MNGEPCLSPKDTSAIDRCIAFNRLVGAGDDLAMLLNLLLKLPPHPDHATRHRDIAAQAACDTVKFDRAAAEAVMAGCGAHAEADCNNTGESHGPIADDAMQRDAATHTQPKKLAETASGGRACGGRTPEAPCP